MNYNGVRYGEIYVCNLAENVEPEAVLYAMDAWNNMIGKPVLTTDCPPYSGIVIIDVEEGDCGYDEYGNPYWACGQYPYEEDPLLLRIAVTPIVGEQSLTLQKSVVGHEMGHDLGFAHWSTCDSIMHATCLAFTEPQPVDAENYEKAYSVEAVTNLAGSSPSPEAVSLSWSPVNSAGEELCNEKEFTVWRWNPSAAWYDIYVATAGQDSTGVSFGGQPCGSRSYAVWSMTEARHYSFGGYDAITLNVGGPGDCDGAGFTDSAELFMGTDLADNCADTATANDERGPDYGEPLSPWPPDFNDNGDIEIGDLVLFKQHWVPTGGTYHHRYDLNANGQCDIGDLIILQIYWGMSCTVG